MLDDFDRSLDEFDLLYDPVRPPIRHLPFSSRLAGWGGLTMSLEGDLDELEEFLRSFATSASSFSMRTSNRRISAISSSLVCDSSGFMFPWIGRNRHFTSPRQPKKPVNGYAKPNRATRSPRTALATLALIEASESDVLVSTFTL